MSNFIKDKAKQLRLAVQAKEWPAVEEHARAVLSFESSNYNARVFLALALTNLERYDEAEESYKRAIESAPSQILARQGLASFYEKRQRWSEYAQALRELLEQVENIQDSMKYAETLAKLVDVRRSHGTPEQLVEALQLLLPMAPNYSLLSDVPPIEPTNPTATSFYAVQQAISSPLTVLLEIVPIIETIESSIIESEIRRRRQRLGGPTLSAQETRRLVCREYMLPSRLPDLYKAILNDVDASDREDLRREVERKLLRHWTTLLDSLPSSFDEPELNLSKAAPEVKSAVVLDEQDRVKNSVRWEIEQMAQGMVVIGVEEEQAWEIVFDWQDRYCDIATMNWHELERYRRIFPDSGLAMIINLARRYRDATLKNSSLNPLSVVNQDDSSPVQAIGISGDVLATGVEVSRASSQFDREGLSDFGAFLPAQIGLQRSPGSILAHLLATHCLSEEADWASVAAVGIAGLELLRRREIETGRGLPASRRNLESRLAVALVHHEAPAHHPRALRLIDSLINASTAMPVPTVLLTAKALILHASEKWRDAIDIWNRVLADDSLEIMARATAQSERGWALCNDLDLELARFDLEKAVATFDHQHEVRVEEQRVKEVARSKEGMEKSEGAEEGDSSRAAEERAKAWWRLGQCLWVHSEREPDSVPKAFDAFQRSIRAVPEYAPAFTSLGVYYRSIEPPDWIRASKCFQKAFELDGSEELAARYLAEELADLQEWSLVDVIARRVVEAAGTRAIVGGSLAQKLAWAYKAIGGAELNCGKYVNSIVAFQSALRGTPDDVHTWIRLGTAYRASGKHVAALKVFSKALSLDPASWFAKFSIGDVQREMGLFEPALSCFRSLLEERPDEVGIRVVLAETLLAAGCEHVRAGLFARAETLLVETLSEIVRMIDRGDATRVGWKLAAEASTTLSKMSGVAFSGTAKAASLAIVDSILRRKTPYQVDGIELFDIIRFRSAASIGVSPAFFAGLAVLSNQVRVVLETQNETAIGAAWADLGTSIANVRPFLSQLSSGSSEQSALQAAIRALKFALHKEPLNPSFWNALGVLAFDLSPRLAQHCFIRSIEHDSRSVIAWTNLGLFYLVHGEEDLANQAFFKSQVVDPEWAAAWVGQATLADMAKHRPEAAILFEHAFSLSAETPEADIAFAFHALENYLTSTSEHIELVADMFDPVHLDATKKLSAGLFAITRYLSRRPDDISGLHVSGLILEQLGDRAAACAAFEQAALLLEHLYEIDESSQTEGQFVIAQTNLGRVRLANTDYEGALTAFDAALSLIDLQGNYSTAEKALTLQQAVLLYAECKLGSSLAYFFLDDCSQAEEVLEIATEDLEEYPNNHHVNLTVALCRVFYSKRDEDRALGALLDIPDVTKWSTPFFTKMTFQALAVTTRDSALNVVLTRLKGSDPVIKYSGASTKLSTIAQILQNNHGGAMRMACRTLHAAPWKRSNRARLAKVLTDLSGSSDLPIKRSDVVPIVLRLFYTSRSLSIKDEDHRASHCFGFGALAIANNEDVELAVRQFEKSVHFSPWMKGSRTAITAARSNYGGYN